MKIKIINIKENLLMKRKELQGIIEHDGMPTPSRASVQKYLAKEIKANEKHVDVRKIFSAVGKDDAKLIAFIWKDKEVPILEEKKPKAEKEEKKEENKAEEKKSEVSKEESKQETKAEPEEPKQAKKEEPKTEPKPETEPEKKVEAPEKEPKKENTEEKTETEEKKEAKKEEKPKK